MKSLVLLYRLKSSDAVTIKEYPKVEDFKGHYVVGENWLRNKEGILKKYVDKVCHRGYYLGGRCDGHPAAQYPIELPAMGTMDWNEGYFIFVNKTRYDENPTYYYDVIKNYRES